MRGGRVGSLAASPTLVGAVTVLVIVYLFVNLLVDLLYGLLDPRISHD